MPGWENMKAVVGERDKLRRRVALLEYEKECLREANYAYGSRHEADQEKLRELEAQMSEPFACHREAEGGYTCADTFDLDDTRQTVLTLQAELLEARSEIVRHHSLIERMRDLLAQARWRMLLADELSIEIHDLLKREVGYPETKVPPAPTAGSDGGSVRSGESVAERA